MQEVMMMYSSLHRKLGDGPSNDERSPKVQKKMYMSKRTNPRTTMVRPGSRDKR